MKLYACYSPSHRQLLEQHFLPSLPNHWKDARGNALFDSDVVIRHMKQRSASGAFQSDGFQATCLDKVDFIIDAIDREKEPFLFSDVDVRFYGPVVDDLLKCLGGADMAFQWDGPRGKQCTGFMVIRPNERTRMFWTGVRQWMTSKVAMDQDAAHAMMYVDRFETSTCVARKPDWVILPERYWTFGRNDMHWKPGDIVNPPADLLVHHANWTVGVENKLKLLEAVKEKMSNA